MANLETLLNSLIGRTILDVGTEDEELSLFLDDGRVLWIYCEEDEMFMSVSDEEQKPTQ